LQGSDLLESKLGALIVNVPGAGVEARGAAERLEVRRYELEHETLLPFGMAGEDTKDLSNRIESNSATWRGGKLSGSTWSL
jgi:hypothetical protein